MALLPDQKLLKIVYIVLAVIFGLGIIMVNSQSKFYSWKSVEFSMRNKRNLI